MVVTCCCQGLSVREIVEIVRLPPHLASHPYLIEYYGTVGWGVTPPLHHLQVEWSVKAVYHGYLGWFRFYLTQ